MCEPVTITFALLGKIGSRDALCYIAAQFAGGLAGVLAVQVLLGSAFTLPPVVYVVTIPGDGGAALAFGMELLISFVMMMATLTMSNQAKLMRYTGLCCGVLIMLFVTFEAPFSGMSMNPARTFASAALSGIWFGIWVYFTAPLAGMLLAALAFRAIHGATVQCAKLNHDTGVDCHFHCGFRAQGIHAPDLIHPHQHFT